MISVIFNAKYWREKMRCSLPQNRYEFFQGDLCKKIWSVISLHSIRRTGANEICFLLLQTKTENIKLIKCNCNFVKLKISFFLFEENMPSSCSKWLFRSPFWLREDLNWKKTFSFGHCPNNGGGGLPMPEFFGPLFRSAFLVNKKSLFLQKCIELLTVF